MPKEIKIQRIGMRVAPTQKERWEATAKAWGYSSLTSWISAMCDWAINYEDFDNFESYMESINVPS